jgi:hypothetical protein
MRSFGYSGVPGVQCAAAIFNVAVTAAGRRTNYEAYGRASFSSCRARPPILSDPRRKTMRNTSRLAAAVLSVGLMMQFGMASAMDDMKKDSMGKDAHSMKKDAMAGDCADAGAANDKMASGQMAMANGGMKKDAMAADGMARDTMKKGASGKDCVPGAMKKDAMKDGMGHDAMKK